MYNPAARLLLADQDTESRRELRDGLEHEGFLVREVSDGSRLLGELREETPHLVVLDLELPPMRGLENCRRIKQYGDVPIVVLTALDDEQTKLDALDSYAEDYILKPARNAEVVARIRRVLRRTWLIHPPAHSGLRVDERLSLDFLRREAITPKGAFRLTPIETRLLQLLVYNAGQILPTELLLERVWGDACASCNSLWEHVRRIRHKIGDDATKPRYILNEPGLGYGFCRPTRGVSTVHQCG